MKRIILILLISIILFSGCPQDGGVNLEDASGKKVLMIIAPSNFRDEELFDTKAALEEAGASVTVASKTTDNCTGMLGGTIKPDITLDEVNITEYNAVAFIGGSGSSVYFNDEKALNIAREVNNSGKVVAAICIAPSILANAGILEGKNATAFSSEQGNLTEKGANYTGQAVTTDGKIVTANGPAAARQFAAAIIEAMK